MDVVLGVALFLADIASYQKTLSIAQLCAAGFGGINVKVSHGLTQKSVHPNVQAYVREAREAGMALSCFHWLDGSARGAAQADYAYRQMALLGLNVAGVAHVCDCESDATQGIYEDYSARMGQLLGRPIITYTGDWWWTWERPRWLWSAPEPGYQPIYPGDDSPLWDAEGWRLDVMQYRVSPINGINVSQSAVRNLELWQEMIGMVVYSVPASTTLRDEFNAVSPGRDKTSDGTIGDLAHAESVSDHNLDETGNTGGVEDNDDIDEVHARDVDSSGPWPSGWTMEKFVQLILARCRSGQEKRLRYIIYERRIWRKSNGWVQETYTGPNPHDKHAHFSFEYGSGSGTSNPENITTPYGIVEAAMPLTDGEYDRIATEVVEKFWATPYGSESYSTRTARALARDLHAERDYAVGDGKGAAYANVKAGSFLDVVGKMAQQNAGQVAALLAAIQDDEVPVDPAAVALAILPALTAAIIAELPEGTLTAEEVQAASERGVRNVLRSGVDE